MGISNSRAADNRRKILAGIRGGATTGDVFYVDSTNAGASDTAGRGRTPSVPFATLDFADTQCADNNGDVIILMPGHAENIATATALTLATVGVSVVGLGNGTDQPTLTFITNTAADCNIDAANITIENVHFVANLQDIAVCIDVNATDFTCRDCRFTDSSNALNFLVCIQDGATSTSDRMTIEGCRCFGLDLTDTHFVNLAGTGTGHVIQDNILNGTWATMCIGGAGVVTSCMILRNNIFNLAAGADLCISMAATATGLMAQNNCTGGHATQGIIPGDLGAIENYYEDHITDLSGIIEPAIA